MVEGRLNDMGDVEETLRAHVLREYLRGEPPESLRDDTPLRSGGVLDSLAVLSLVQFVEDAFGITVEAHEAGITNFDSIEDMAAFVRRKRGGGS